MPRGDPADEIGDVLPDGWRLDTLCRMPAGRWDVDLSHAGGGLEAVVTTLVPARLDVR